MATVSSARYCFCLKRRDVVFARTQPHLLLVGGGGECSLVVVLLINKYTHIPTLSDICIVMAVLTVSTNVLSVNYTDEQGQVSAPIFSFILGNGSHVELSVPNGISFLSIVYCCAMIFI